MNIELYEDPFNDSKKRCSELLKDINEKAGRTFGMLMADYLLKLDEELCALELKAYIPQSSPTKPINLYAAATEIRKKEEDEEASFKQKMDIIVKGKDPTPRKLDANPTMPIHVFENKLKDTLNQINADPTRKQIQSLRKRAGPFTVGMREKADRIEQALNNVPFSEQANVMESKSPAALAVQKELASNRHFWKKGKELHTDGTIVENKASNSFINAKKAYAQFKEVYHNKRHNQPESKEDPSKSDKPVFR